jgi:hypothetical protein
VSPDEVALEHVLWAASDGQDPATIMEALGVPVKHADWDDVLLALRIVWRRTQPRTVPVVPLKRAA